jgi:hypothetical protein
VFRTLCLCFFLPFHPSVFGIQLADLTVTEVLVNLVDVVNWLLFNKLYPYVVEVKTGALLS